MVIRFVYRHQIKIRKFSNNRFIQLQICFVYQFQTCFYRQISKEEGAALATEFECLFFETTAAEEFEYVEDIFHGLVHEIQRERGEKHIHFQPLFITEEKFQSAQRGGRPKSPRSPADRKDDKTGSKKNSSSFKLFNKSFKIFN